MTIQTLFDRASLYDNQLDLIAGGDDVARGLVAVNLVQDWWEMAASEYANLCQTYSTFTTVADQEYTEWPTALLRLDVDDDGYGFFLLDANGVQIRAIEPIDKVGGHRPAFPLANWPIDQITGNPQFGAPWEFYASGQGNRIMWAPTPDAVYTIRAYGLWAKADYTAAADTFLYPDSVALALAPFVAALFKIGLERGADKVQGQAEAAFRRVAKTMSRQVHRGGQSRTYSQFHTE